jgi:hypothetical protein
MIERHGGGLDDVAVASQMLRMAGAALCAGDAGQAPVHAACCAQVGGDVLVAVQAQGGLPTLVSAVVAQGALLLLLLVRTTHLARHQQAFEAGGTGSG